MAWLAGASQIFYDSQLNWVPLMFQKRPRYVEDAVLMTLVMDGKQPDCVWDRLMLDAAIPGETQVTVYSRAGNDRNCCYCRSRGRWNPRRTCAAMAPRFPGQKKRPDWRPGSCCFRAL